MTKKIKTTKSEICNFWKPSLEAGTTSVTFKQAPTHCWRCGIKKRLDRCHIVPHSKGGQDCPSNFILLCKHCHFDNPNLDNPEIIWDWLKAYRIVSEMGFWFDQGEREYEYVYKTSIDARLKMMGYDNRERFYEVFNDLMNGAGHHFGQPRKNRATVAGTIQLTLNKLEE